jgi:hypothetical protein
VDAGNVPLGKCITFAIVPSTLPMTGNSPDRTARTIFTFTAKEPIPTACNTTGFQAFFSNPVDTPIIAAACLSL